jgi:hypothetical protein
LAIVLGLMLRRAAALAVLLASLAAPCAAAGGEMRCWVDRGAVVVSAAFGDIAGDFLLDLTQPKTLLEADVAALDGIDGTTARRELRLAGEGVSLKAGVTALDARTLGLPTTLNGLIGADAFAGDVIELRLSPCRITVWRGPAPPLRHARRLPLRLVGGVPSVRATVGDGVSTLAGWFALDTGTAGVRISGNLAHLARAPAAGDPGSRLAPPGRLASLRLGAASFAALPAAIEPQPTPGLDGTIGTAVWSHYVVRMDFRRMRLFISPSP